MKVVRESVACSDEIYCASAKRCESAGASLAVLHTFVVNLAVLRSQRDSKLQHHRHIVVI
jgi:hypothetical protein